MLNRIPSVKTGHCHEKVAGEKSMFDSFWTTLYLYMEYVSLWLCRIKNLYENKSVRQLEGVWTRTTVITSADLWSKL